MKTLYLLRHAKSSWDHSILADFDRPLNEKGYSDAHNMGSHLFKKNILPDVFLSSPAIRAISTALLVSTHLKFPVDQIQIRKNLYDSSVKQYLQCISYVAEGESILLVGHNEVISETAQKLSSQRLEEMKTCAVIALEFEIHSWKELPNSSGNLIFQIHPGVI